jgi:hypothetical protein
MGTRARHKPARLAVKLSQIRAALGLSQNCMIKQLGVEEMIGQNTVSEEVLSSLCK